MTLGPEQVLEIGCALYWAAAMALLIVSVVATIVQPWVCARRATRQDQPPVSVVLPVKLVEAGFESAQESVFEQEYPCFEALASCDDGQSPAAKKMREIFARHPQIPSRFLVSTAKFAKSPKVDNLFAPFTEAKNDVIFMKDSNVVLEKGALVEHLRQLTDDVGLVCAIPYAAGPENLAAHIEAAIMNGPHARMLFLAAAFGQGFGVGKIMLFRRSDFLRAGGFGAIAHTVGEDNAMAKAVRRIGLRSIFSHLPVRQELGRRNLRDVYHRQLRWSVIRREDELFSFVLEPICQALPAFAAAAAAAPVLGQPPLVCAALTAAAWFSLETMLSFIKGWRLSWAAPAVFLLREGVMFAVWLHAWTTSRVVWAKDALDARAAVSSPLARPTAKKEG